MKTQSTSLFMFRKPGKNILCNLKNGYHIYYNKQIPTNAQSKQNPEYKFCFQISEPKQGGADGVWKETSREV